MCLSTASSDAIEQLEIGSFTLKRDFKPRGSEQDPKSFDYQSSFSLSDSETQLSQEDIDIPQLNPKIDIFDLDILENLSSHGGVEAPYTIQNEKTTQQDGETLDWNEYKPNKAIFHKRSFSILCDGVLSFIKKHADQKMKIEYEIWYEFSSVLNPQFFNPFSLMDPNDSNYYSSALSIGQYVKFSLKRVAVCPTAYFLMSDKENKVKLRLRSFAFQARLYPESSEWETLDERFEINNLIKQGGYSIFYVDTDKYYNEFRVVQTSPIPIHKYHGFSLGFFEIHGDVKMYQRTKAAQDLSIYF